MEPRYGVRVGGRAPRRLSGDHVRAVVVVGELDGVVGGVGQRLIENRLPEEETVEVAGGMVAGVERYEVGLFELES